MTKRTNPRRDFTQIAFAVVQEATGEVPSSKLTGKKADSSKGGKARADKLTPEERSEIAKKAAKARWNP